jgi:hypothetical protein
VKVSSSNVKPKDQATGAVPVLTTEGGNPETLKEKVADSLERQANGSLA